MRKAIYLLHGFLWLILLIAVGFLLKPLNLSAYAAISNNDDSSVEVSGEEINESYTYYLEWTNLSVVFNGKSQSPTATLKCEEDEVFEKEATITIQKNGELATAIDAGDYVAVATCEGVSFSSGDKKDFTISPLSVAVQWSKAESYTYSGSVQSPTASYTDVSGQTIPLTPTGAGTEAGSHNVSVSSDAAGSNYILTNLTCQYTISPLSVAVQWSKAESYTYNGSAQSPTASYTNVSGQTIPLTPTGAGTEAGSHNVSVSSDAAGSNYTLTNLTCEYTISPLSVAVHWSKAESYTYSGKEQGPTASYENVNGQTVSLAVSGLGTDAGTHTANVSSDAAGGNYNLTGLTCEYTIDKLSAAILWVDFNFVANGEVQMPRAFAAGLNGEIIELPVKASGEKAGNYTAEIDVTKVNANFDLNGDLSFSYKILPPAEFGITGTALSVVFGVLFIGAVACIVYLTIFRKKTSDKNTKEERDNDFQVSQQLQEKEYKITQLTFEIQTIIRERDDLYQKIITLEASLSSLKSQLVAAKQTCREAERKLQANIADKDRLLNLEEQVKRLLEENAKLKSVKTAEQHDFKHPIEDYLPEIDEAFKRAISFTYNEENPIGSFASQRQEIEAIMRLISTYRSQRR